MQINAAAVARLRESYPLSRGELAERVGMSRQAIWLIESGTTRRPKPSNIRAIAEALGVPAADLMEPVEVAS